MREFARKVFSGEDKDHSPCPDCGGVHARACPRIRSEHVVLNGEGNPVERHVEYWAPSVWEHVSWIIWPEDAWDPGDPGAGADGDSESGRVELG